MLALGDADEFKTLKKIFEIVGAGNEIKVVKKKHGSK
jgi:hypothetical protein